MLMLCYGQELAKGNWFENKTCVTKAEVKCNKISVDLLQDFHSDFCSRDCSWPVLLSSLCD